MKTKLTSFFAVVGIGAYVVWMVNRPSIPEAWGNMFSEVGDLVMAHVRGF